MFLSSPQPEIFQDDGIARARNQDGSINSRSNPAAAGSLVSIWLTGQPSPPLQAGLMGPLSLRTPSETEEGYRTSSVLRVLFTTLPHVFVAKFKSRLSEKFVEKLALAEKHAGFRAGGALKR